MMTGRNYLVLLLIAISAMSAEAQGDLAETLKARAVAYRQTTLQEKIFVHTDKDSYLAGEIIWFKAYVTDAYQHKPIDISKVVYIDIFNRDGKSVLQTKAGITAGNANGSIVLPVSISSGNYTVRAYTKWMRNFPSETFFHKNITVVNTLRKTESARLADSSRLRLQVFPEGGNLVSGLKSRVAFIAANEFGKPVTGNGFLLADSRDTLLRFKTMRDGMGSFDFEPIKGKTYKLVVEDQRRIMGSVSLPAAFAEGVVTILTSNTEDVEVTAKSNNPRDNNLTLVVQNRGTNSYARTKTLNDGAVTFQLPKNMLQPGVSHFLIYNAAGTAVSERLFFMQPAAGKNLEINTDNASYGLRKPVSIGFTGLPSTVSPADMSISVFKTDSLQADNNDDDILSYLWLKSEIPGGVESPGFYFRGAEGEKAADLLMMTKGWRRFRWEDMYAATASRPVFLPEYEGLVVSGKLVERRSGRPARNTPAYLSAPGSRFIYTNALSNDQGDVLFNTRNFFGGNEIVVQTNYDTDSNYRVDISSPFEESISQLPAPGFSMPAANADLLLERSLGMQSMNAFREDELQRFSFPFFSDTVSFYGRPDRRYALDDYTRFVTMEEVMREYVSEVRLRKERDKFSFTVLNAPYKIFFDAGPLILLDGVPVFNTNKIIAFDPLKIKSLEVVTRKYYLGSNAYDGIVSYKTYDGDMAGYALDPNSTIVEYPGLQLEREFYSPVYDAGSDAGRIPDMRNVLYWSPEVSLNGKPGAQFFTSDIPGKYKVVVQGIGGDGELVSGVQYFTVRE